MKNHHILALAWVILVSGCSLLSRHALDEQYGPADPKRFDAMRAPLPGLAFRRDVQPILERRCVVCHACYDAPCQQKLTSWEGIARGSSKDRVYATRLREAQPTRLFADAQTASQWRNLGFSAVLNERDASANLAASVLYRLLRLKAQHPLPAGSILPPSFDFSLDRAESCPRIEELDAFERENPFWGMPFGLPGLTTAEMSMVTRWLEAGAPFEGMPPLPKQVEEQLDQWERFLNGDSLKQRLVSRYLYEHLFLAHLFFDNDAQRHYFQLVRSRTPPGVAVDLIASRRPYDDPGVDRVYYRFVRERETVVDKTHMPYALGAKRLLRWRELFFKPDYAVDELPGYDPDAASNPFTTFRALPVRARYQFLLDEAEFTIMGFIKGPVCRGQVALDVIQDRFWVFFVANHGVAQARDEFLDRQAQFLRLPSEEGSNARIIGPWRRYAQIEEKYLQEKSAVLTRYALDDNRPDLDWIWKGEGVNPNAALTVFRHFDSASVVKGLLGEPPKTAWLIGYPLLERIHYLLVAGFDVYGNIGHQFLSRLYMDFMRMEGEFNFLALLPLDRRREVRDYWYRGADEDVKNHVYGSLARLDVDSAIPYLSKDPLPELYAMLRKHMAPVLDRRHELTGMADVDLRRDLGTLAALRGPALSWLPEVVILRIDQPARVPAYFTLLRNTGHSNVTSLLREGRNLLPAENSLTVVSGFIGAYPNAIYRVERSQVPALTQAIAGLAGETDYRALADRFAVRRTHPDFWPISDALQDEHLQREPIRAGLLDYGRLENR